MHSESSAIWELPYIEKARVHLTFFIAVKNYLTENASLNLRVTGSTMKVKTDF